MPSGGLGRIVVTMSPLFTVSEMVQELSDAGAHYLVAAPEVMDRAVEAARRCQVRKPGARILRPARVREGGGQTPGSDGS